MKTVITRIWHGVVRTEQSDDYLQYVTETGVKDYKLTPGNLSVKIWRYPEGDKTHFWTVTTWDSVDSIKKFAGEDYERAHYYDRDQEFLLEFEPKVLHYETLEF